MNTPPVPQKRRQRFAYFYAKGYPVAEVARQADYSETIATRNGARLVQGKRMKIIIERYQKAFNTLEVEALPAAVNRLMGILQSDAPANQILAATRAIIKTIKAEGPRPLKALNRNPQPNQTKIAIATGIC